MDDHDDLSIVIRANHDLEAGEELTVVYPKCYSTSFTLYKYGFLAYRPAAHDAALFYQQHGEGGMSKDRLTKAGPFGGDDGDYPDAIGDEEDFAAQRAAAVTTYAQDVGAVPIP